VSIVPTCLVVAHKVDFLTQETFARIDAGLFLTKLYL